MDSIDTSIFSCEDIIDLFSILVKQYNHDSVTVSWDARNIVIGLKFASFKILHLNYKAASNGFDKKTT